MRNFVTKFGKIFEICMEFAGNQVNSSCIFIPSYITQWQRKDFPE